MTTLPTLLAFKVLDFVKLSRDAIYYPAQYSQDDDFMFNDSSEQRGDEHKTLDYLRKKYGIADMHTFDLKMHAGIMRVSNNDSLSP
jgi:hypothetical protein